MASTYSSNVRLELMASGENDSTWGTKTNTNLQLLEAAIAGRSAVTHDDTANYTLTTANGAADEARRMILNIGGALSAARNVVCPTQTKFYVVKNATTGGYAVTLKTSGGTGIAVPNGKTMMLFCDGTNVVESIDTIGGVTFAGTTGTTMTFPSTSATIARTDAANTFTGVQSMTSPDITTSVTTPSATFTAFAGATTLLNLGGTGALASTALPSTLDSTSISTGSLRTAGGLGVTKALWVGGLANIAGAVTLQSTLTYGGVTLTNAVTGTGKMVLDTNNVLVTPNIGTPSAGVLTNCTGLPIAGTTGYGTGVATALAVNVGSAGAFTTFNGALGTPSSGVLSNLTGTLNAAVVASSLTSVGTITSGVWNAGAVTSSGGISGTTGVFSDTVRITKSGVVQLAIKRSNDANGAAVDFENAAGTMLWRGGIQDGTDAYRLYNSVTGINSFLVASATDIITMAAYGAGTATFSAAGVISSVSDERLKIKDGVIKDPIPMLMALEPGYFYGKPEANMGDARQLGFYAQNVRKAVGPEAAPDPVEGKPWGYFDRSVLAVAIETGKNHEARLRALEQR